MTTALFICAARPCRSPRRPPAMSPIRIPGASFMPSRKHNPRGRIALRAAVLLCTAATAAPAYAFNYFELEVYPYRTAAHGELEIESSNAYTVRGTDDPADGNTDLARSSLEATYGLTDHVEVAAYADAVHNPARGRALTFAGQRYHLRARFFQKGELPVDLGSYIEYELPKIDEDKGEVELRGILEKDLGRWTFDFNPIFEKVVRGENTSAGWTLMYASALVYRLSEALQPRLEWYGDVGPINHPEPWERQVQLLSPAVTYSPTPTFHVLAGWAFGLTPASERHIARLNLEWEFY